MKTALATTAARAGGGKYAKAEGAAVVAICAANRGADADPGRRGEANFLADMGLEEPGLDRLIRARLHAARSDTPIPSPLVRRRCAPGPCTSARNRAAGRGVIPTRLRTRLHPRRGDLIWPISSPARRTRRQGSGEDASGGQGLRSARRRRHAFSLQRLIDSAPVRRAGVAGCNARRAVRANQTGLRSGAASISRAIPRPPNSASPFRH